MALVHNLIIRGINAIYLQSRGVGERGTEADKLDFTNFALRWARFVDEHHHSEEAHIFPSIEKTAGAPGLMEGNVTEHAAFHDGVETFRAYLEAVVAGREAFDAGTVRGLVDGFMPTLRTHLAGEIQTLLALERYEDRADWGAWFEASVKEMVDGQMKSAQYRVRPLPRRVVVGYTDRPSTRFSPSRSCCTTRRSRAACGRRFRRGRGSWSWGCGGCL